MPTPAPMAAILLAGGRARRMGGVDKPMLPVGGIPMLRRAVDAVRAAGCTEVTVVGPERVADVEQSPGTVRWVREDPPFTGPAAAVVAALTAAGRDDDMPTWTVVLACDLPHPDEATAQLTAALALVANDSDGVCLSDASHRPQWLTAVYRTSTLRARARALPDAGRNAPVHALVSDLALTVVPAAGGAAADVDTWEDLRRHEEEMG